MIEKRRKPPTSTHCITVNDYQEDVEDFHALGHKRNNYWRRFIGTTPGILIVCALAGLGLLCFILFSSSSSSSSQIKSNSVLSTIDATAGETKAAIKRDDRNYNKNVRKKEFPVFLKEETTPLLYDADALDKTEADVAAERKPLALKLTGSDSISSRSSSSGGSSTSSSSGSSSSSSSSSSSNSGSTAVTASRVVSERESSLIKSVEKQLTKIRHMKFNEHVVMETSEDAKKEIALLQQLLRELVPLQYGPEPYRIEMQLRFPESMQQQQQQQQQQSIVFELGPLEFVPYSTYYFLNNIVLHWKTGAFHRNAGHVLQAMARMHVPTNGLAFQEYHPSFPHYKYTLGYAGRPGGPEFYISTLNNVGNHGPGSQGSKTEADSCFGKIIDGIDVVKRMQQQPGAAKGAGFISDRANHIIIERLTLLPHSTSAALN